MQIREALKNLMQRAGVSPSTSRDQPYVLTERDEEIAIYNAKKQTAGELAWRMKDKGLLQDQIEARLKKVDWNKLIDRASVLAVANRNKLYQMWLKKHQAEKEAVEQQKAEKLAQECDYGYFYNLMKVNCRRYVDPMTNKPKDLIENEDTLQLIKTICFFLSRDPRFETELGYNLNKGLLLRGTCGLGKTFLFSLVKDNPVRPVNVMSMIEIADQVQTVGYFIPQDFWILCFDDLGSERELVNHYGNKINWFKDFFEMYYLRRRGFHRLVVSTNLSFDELEQKYGYRFRSRVKDVFNIVNVTGEDLRGK